jgi:hypothetical protein
MAWPATDNTPKSASYGIEGDCAYAGDNYDGTPYGRDKSPYIWRTATMKYIYRTNSLWTAVKSHFLSVNKHTSFTLPIWETGAAVNKTVYYTDMPTCEHSSSHTLSVSVSVKFQEALT